MIKHSGRVAPTKDSCRRQHPLKNKAVHLNGTSRGRGLSEAFKTGAAVLGDTMHRKPAAFLNSAAETLQRQAGEAEFPLCTLRMRTTCVLWQEQVGFDECQEYVTPPPPVCRNIGVPQTSAKCPAPMTLSAPIWSEASFKCGACFESHAALSLNL